MILNVGSLKKNQSGVSLIELMVSLSVLAILLAIGVPAFQSTIESNRLYTTSNALSAAFAHARSEAIRQGKRITVCKSSDQAQCASSGGWEQGWITFVDNTSNNSSPSLEAGDTLLSTSDQLATGIKVKGSSALASYISYTSSGQAKALVTNKAVGGDQNSKVAIRVCTASISLDDSQRARDLELDFSGRIAVVTPASVASSCPSP